MLTIAALSAPFAGAGARGCDGAAMDAGMTTDSSVGMTHMTRADAGHCDACDSGEPDTPPPCERADASPCATMSSCASLSMGAVVHPGTAALDSPAQIAHVDVVLRPFGVRLSPEPPPPRA